MREREKKKYLQRSNALNGRGREKERERERENAKNILMLTQNCQLGGAQLNFLHELNKCAKVKVKNFLYFKGYLIKSSISLFF